MNYAAMDRDALKVERMRLEAEESKAKSDWMNHRISTSLNIRAQREAQLCEIRYLIGLMDHEDVKRRRNDLLSTVIATMRAAGHGALVDAAVAEHREEIRKARESCGIKSN